MKERPILMSGPLVMKTLADDKTQTRRLVRWPVLGLLVGGKRRLYTAADVEKHRAEIIDLCPHGRSGHRLWVKETFAPLDAEGEELNARMAPPEARAMYRADHSFFVEPVRWRPSIFMTRALSRLTLEIAEVRIERVQEISGADAKAEGIETAFVPGPMSSAFRWRDYSGHSSGVFSPRESFASLWQAINGARPGASWDANPFVWAITFKRVAS